MQICVDCSSMVCVRYNSYYELLFAGSKGYTMVSTLKVMALRLFNFFLLLAHSGIGELPILLNSYSVKLVMHMGKALYRHKSTIFVVGICSLQDHPATLLQPLYLPRKPFIEGLYFKPVKNKSYLSSWLNWIKLYYLNR